MNGKGALLTFSDETASDFLKDAEFQFLDESSGAGLNETALEPSSAQSISSAKPSSPSTGSSASRQGYPDTSSPSSSGSLPRTVTVSTAEELVNAIDSDTTILLNDGVYNLSSISRGAFSTNKKYWETVYDGKQLFIQQVNNLTIQGASPNCQIIVTPRYANVLSFSNCTNIKIMNITAGHTPAGECMGGVFWFDKCTDVQIDNCRMYGCGTDGLYLEKVRNMRVTNSSVYECTNSIMYVLDSYDILFYNCTFRDTDVYDQLVTITGTQEFRIDNCRFNDNRSSDTGMFYVLDSTGIVVKDSAFNRNTAKYLDDSGLVSFQSNEYSGNSFD